MAIEKFEDLEVWKLARELCRVVFRVTSKNGFEQDFRLKAQIRASSGSIMDNIAEGFDRNGNKEFTQFLHIAKGSCGETRSQSYRAFDFGYIDESELEDLCQRTAVISKQLGGFIEYLKRSELRGSKYK
ncbi:MAG: four helix bundle protein [Saprospiraceae bacterium]|nr:four helix bundle protein [Saprospiraceae bacterium]HRD80969.1 four helix bundle protein [Saprospiraceae bacterium]